MKNFRSNFGLFYKDVNLSPDSVDFNELNKGDIIEKELIQPVVIEGADIYDTVCPVSKFTGHRESPLALLGKITGADSALLNAVLQELPTVASNPALSDQDRADFLVSRLCSGTPAENAIVAKHIMNDLEALGLKAPEVEKVVDSPSIEFKSSEVPDSSETV